MPTNTLVEVGGGGDRGLFYLKIEGDVQRIWEERAFDA